MNKSVYLTAAEAYIDGVRVLYTPSGVPTGERGDQGPVSYDDLATKAEQLVLRSDDLTKATTSLLGDVEPALRIRASNSLLVKAMTDLDISAYLLQAAMDEEDELTWTEGSSRERSLSGYDGIEDQLSLILSLGEADIRALERGEAVPDDIPSARIELSNIIDETLVSIPEMVNETAQTGLSGLFELGINEVTQAAGAIGVEIAQTLGQAEKLTRLYRLVRDFALKAYDSVLALVGSQLVEMIGQRVLEWFKAVKEGNKFTEMLEALYGTQQTNQEMGQLINSSQAELEKFRASIEEVDGLEEAYRLQVNLVNRLLPKLKFLRLLPAIMLPLGRLLLAATYIVIIAYVVLAGGDYVDARLLDRLDRIPGVRKIVEANLQADAIGGGGAVNHR